MCFIIQENGLWILFKHNYLPPQKTPQTCSDTWAYPMMLWKSQDFEEPRDWVMQSPKYSYNKAIQNI